MADVDNDDIYEQHLPPRKYTNLDGQGKPVASFVTFNATSLLLPRILRWKIEFKSRQINDSHRTAHSVVRLAGVETPLFHKHDKDFGNADCSGEGSFELAPFTSVIVTAECANFNAESDPGHPRIILTIADA